MFAINPSGGSTSAITHVPIRLSNPESLPPLSTTITPSARIRPRKRILTDMDTPQIPSDLGAVFTFLPYRRNPLLPAVSCLDIALYRPSLGQIDITRLSVRAVQPSAPQMEVTRRASALTEMMRAKVGLVASDLGVDSTICATWQLPLDSLQDLPQGDDGSPLLSASEPVKEKRVVKGRSAQRYVYIPSSR